MKTLIKYELKKIFQNRLSVFALAAVLLFSLLTALSSYFSMTAYCPGLGEGKGAEAVRLEKQLAQQYGGILTDQKVKTMVQQLVPKEGPGGINVQYLYQNSLQSAVGIRFCDLQGNYNGISVSTLGDNVKVGFVAGWLTTSQNILRVMILMYAVLAVILAPVFCCEYSGMDSIIMCTGFGRENSAKAKTAAGFITAFAVCFVTLALNIGLGFLLYGADGLDCSANFAPESFASANLNFNLSCLELLGYQILFAFAGVIADGRRARVGFRRQICARAASNPLTIRKVFSSGFSLPEHKFARQKLLWIVLL